MSFVFKQLEVTHLTVIRMKLQRNNYKEKQIKLPNLGNNN